MVTKEELVTPNSGVFTDWTNLASIPPGVGAIMEVNIRGIVGGGTVYSKHLGGGSVDIDSYEVYGSVTGVSYIGVSGEIGGRHGYAIHTTFISLGGVYLVGETSLLGFGWDTGGNTGSIGYFYGGVYKKVGNTFYVGFSLEAGGTGGAGLPATYTFVVLDTRPIV